MTTLESRATLGTGALSQKLDDALHFAFEQHRFHVRKGSRVPYLSHLLSVSALVLEHGGSEDQAIAGLLHDAVEDAAPGQGPDVLAAIGDEFGPEVRAMVEACSDSLNDEGGKRPWRERKLDYVAGLRLPAKKSDDALLVTAADKIHNARSIARDLRTYGPSFWGTFSACEHDLLWYYTAVEAAIAERVGAHEVVETLHAAVEDLIAAAGQDRTSVPDEPSDGACLRHAGE